MKKRVVIVLAVVAAAGLLAFRGPEVRAQTSLDGLVGIRDALMKRVPAPTEARIAEALDNRRGLPGISVEQQMRAARNQAEFCATTDGNRLSSLVAYEDNPAASAMEGFVMRDRRGRRTRPWRALRRAEHRSRGVVVQRPLLVFVETPQSQQDFSKPWLGSVRFDRPGFPTTKQKIAEQVFGKNFDHRDPDSVAGFYYRESGGKLVIRGDASSIFSVTVPHISFQAPVNVEAILAQVDPVVDFSKRADQFGWADPIFIMTPFSIVKDVYDPDVMGPAPVGISLTAYDVAPAFTNDVLPDGTHVALASLPLSNLAFYFGANTTPGDLWFGLPEDETRMDKLSLYAHEYGHSIGLGHMMSMDYALKGDDTGEKTSVERFYADSLSREWASGFASTVMNYSAGSGRGANKMPVNQHEAGIDPVNRAKLGWGNVTEITLTDDRRPGPGELVPGGRRRVNLVEHLGIGPHDPRPQILKVNLPAQDVGLFPRLYFDGSNSGYWHPGATGRRMVWSGRTFGGSRTMETTLRIPADVDEPVLSFWTKWGAHSGSPYLPGYEFGWVQISTDQGKTWTSLAGQNSTTTVAPGRGDFDWFGEDLGAPAFTGDSRSLGPNGWIFEQIPLPVAPGRSVRVRFNFSGYFGIGNEIPAEDYGWWIDDVYLGTPGDPTRHLVSSFEEDDERRWTGLLKNFDQGYGFVVVEETTPFPQAYYFELRGSNPHDEAVFTDTVPKDINGRRDDAIYAYDSGVLGYYVNYYSGFSTYPFQDVGSANQTRVPLERLRRAGITHPFVAQAYQGLAFDFGLLLELAFTPSSGLTIDDVAYLVTFPSEVFTLAIADPGFVVPVIAGFPTPNTISVLDANPTYRPLDVSPATATTPFPNRPVWFWPYVLGAPGGWPKSIRHGVLGLNDPTTVRALGQPFLARDAAFHPDRNPVFDDSVNYRGTFFNEFINWHAPTTAAAFGSPADSERITLVLDKTIPVSATESIRQYIVGFCHQSAAGICVNPGQGVKRPWVEQVLYQRLAPMVWIHLQGLCAIPPVATTLATKPAWDAFNACFEPLVPQAHAITNQLVEAARNLGNNPFYAGVNAYGDQGTLSPGLWSAYFLGAWARAKAPAPLPSFGFSMEVEHITSGHTPVATLTLKRQ